MFPSNVIPLKNIFLKKSIWKTKTKSILGSASMLLVCCIKEVTSLNPCLGLEAATGGRQMYFVCPTVSQRNMPMLSIFNIGSFLGTSRCPAFLKT